MARALLYALIGLQFSSSVGFNPQRPPILRTHKTTSSVVREPIDFNGFQFQLEPEQNWVQRLVRERVRTFVGFRTLAAEGLSVGVSKAGRIEVFSGKIPPVELNFSRVELRQLSCSKGGTIRLAQMEFRIEVIFIVFFKFPHALITPLVQWLFNKFMRPFAPFPRPFRRPMEIYGDMTFGLNDVKNSTLVRSLVERLVNIVLGFPIMPLLSDGSRVSEIESVEIVGGKIRVRGRTSGLLVIIYSLSFAISLKADGKIVLIDKFDVTTVDTFAKDFVLIPEIPVGLEVYIGENAKIERIETFGTGIRIIGTSRLSPSPPFRVSEIRESEALLQYRIDLGSMFAELFGISSPGP